MTAIPLFYAAGIGVRRVYRAPDRHRVSERLGPDGREMRVVVSNNFAVNQDGKPFGRQARAAYRRLRKAAE
jgi:hypothetical protein